MIRRSYLWQQPPGPRLAEPGSRLDEETRGTKEILKYDGVVPHSRQSRHTRTPYGVQRVASPVLKQSQRAKAPEKSTMAERPRPTVLRRVLTAIIDPVDREEQGYHQYPTMRGLHDPENEGLYMGSANNPQLARRLTVATTHASTLIPPSDKLLVFRALTGIDTVPALAIPHHHPRSAPNVGIYTRVVRAEQAAAQQFRFFSILMNTCLGIQIVVAAALTALGAARGPHNAVTAFGAINTIMAGILTYLKGSGLPDRLKHYQNEWRNIREYVEQREREFCLDGCQLDVQAEVVFIESMYEGVKREIEATKSGENRSSAGPGQMRRSFLPQARAPELQKQPGKPVAGSPVSVPEPVLEKNQPYERV